MKRFEPLLGGKLHSKKVFYYCCGMPILGYDGCAEPTYASESAAAIITMVFQHTENGGEWCGSISVVFTIV